MSDENLAGPETNGAVSVIERAVCLWITDSRPDDGNSVLRSVGAELLTSKGDFRQSNQDLVAFVRIPEQRSVRAPLCAAIVADGMGGMVDGDGASALAVSAFIAFLTAGDVSGGMKKLLVGAMDHANLRVHRKYGGSGGTTLAAVLYGKQGTTAIHVGDSRIYGMQATTTVRLTVDDTLAEQLRYAKGSNAAPDVPNERDNRLVQFVGIGPNLESHVVDLTGRDAEEPFDHFLLSTDGAHYIGDELLTQIRHAGLDTKSLGPQLVALSRACGSTDNASLVVAPSRVAMDFDSGKKAQLLVDMPGCSLCINVADSSDLVDRKQGADGRQVQKVEVAALDNSTPTTEDGAGRPPARVEKAKERKRKTPTGKKASNEDQVSLGFVEDEDTKAASKQRGKMDGEGEN
ncbi:MULTISPECIES: protein phosphatase 2C domain-containing protein [unclassified Caballeronia]|uniref:PP2C family protein-serine/threonine phosphatase n=1 Tax=unclassified Caballeronia TaxID=2646786 RepID=UPI00285448DB|nr:MULTISPECIES: protein phosphatase 2C domain-containing protein [unclassified Caballeronia]MDR5776281.1 protein phosphatase 2C domain-containing protein [Caballeronia sp. LZ002]MDR5851937.1 protein phosphatase 2C domain-containing protein [Caballeronia sp. LZ003]